MTSVVETPKKKGQRYEGSAGNCFKAASGSVWKFPERGGGWVGWGGGGGGGGGGGEGGAQERDNFGSMKI